MANGQGGLNSIESISGVQAPSTSAVEKITLAQGFGNITMANFRQGSESPNIQQLLASWTDSGAVGLNPFYQKPETATKEWVT